MEKSGKPYADALKEAQQKGYAETNPTADVSGSDAEAKLVAFKRRRLWPTAPTRNNLAQRDRRYSCGGFSLCWQDRFEHHQAPRRGQTDRSGCGGFRLSSFVARDNFLAGIDGATNAICFKAKKSGGSRVERDCDYVLVGPGAGAGPPLSPCSETSASWRTERAGSPDYRV